MPPRRRAARCVLSEFAGAAAEMGEAFIVNPYDTEHTASTLRRVLSSSPDELRDRMTALYTRVQPQRRGGVEPPLPRQRHIPGHRARSSCPVSSTSTISSPRSSRAERRLVVLNHDGVLVPLAPGLLAPTPRPRLLALLTELAAQPGNTVVVASGRPRSDLERWFGAIPGLWLAAENGMLTRSPTSQSLGSAGSTPGDQRGRSTSCRSWSTSLIAHRPASSRPGSTRSCGTTASPTPSSVSGWPTS